MKKTNIFLVIFLAFLLAVLMIACDGKKNHTTTEPTDSVSGNEVTTTEPLDSDSSTVTTEPADTPETTAEPDSMYDGGVDTDDRGNLIVLPRV